MLDQKIGLALGGGGARGFAHLGVLKALTESSIPINFLAGSSMGAVIAAGYAHERNLVKLERHVLDFNYSEYIQPHNRRILIDMEKLVKYFNEYLHNAHFKELDIPLSVITTDFQKKESFVINHGDVSIAIAASCETPYIHKPIKYKNRLLVDGGLVSMLPVDLVEDMGAEIVIGVDVYSSPFSNGDKLYVSQFEKNIMARFPFLSILFSKQAHSFLNHSNQIKANELNNLRLKLVQKPMFIIKPKLKNMTILSFDKKNDAIRAGYEATQIIIPQIKKQLKLSQLQKNKKSNYAPTFS